MSEVLKLAGAALIVAAASRMFAQSPTPRPTFDAFEVATIKPTTLDWPSGGRFIRMQTAHQFVAKNYTLRVILAAAYNLTPGAISGGPAWVDSDRYDIVAETPGQVRGTNVHASQAPVGEIQPDVPPARKEILDLRAAGRKERFEANGEDAGYVA